MGRAETNLPKRSCDYPLLTFSEAWQRIASALKPLPPVEKPLAELAGLILAEEIVARDSMPPFAAAAMDGYAIVGGNGPSERAVTGEQDAGFKLDLTVTPLTAVRIMTGAPLPDGADAVIPFEKTSEEDGVVRLLAPVAPGASVRPAGQDIAAGEVALAKGSELGPAEIGLLASLGHGQALVHPRPRVAIITTGDELVGADAVPRAGQIRDANGPALAAAARAAGFEAATLPCPVADDAAALEGALLDALVAGDLVVTSGGVSMGTRDLIKPLLAKLGRIFVGRVALKPGKPLTFATVQGKPVFGLPGFPVSSLVSFEQFVRPALRLMAGHRLLWRPSVQVRLAQALRHDPERTEFQRALVEAAADGYRARGNGAQGSGRLKSLSGANALLVLPAGTGDFPAGARVTALLINQPEMERNLPLSAGF